MGMMTDKQELRKKMLSLVKNGPSPRPEDVADRICALPEFIEASIVITYIPFPSEVDTSAVIDRALEAGKTVAVPHEKPGDFRLCRPGWRDSLERLSNKCLCPTDKTGLNNFSLNSIIVAGDKLKGIILVPGLAFTEFGTRLGRGAGYYDQLLNLTDKSEQADFTSVGICRKLQLLDDIPQQPHDRKVRMVIAF